MKKTKIIGETYTTDFEIKVDKLRDDGYLPVWESFKIISYDDFAEYIVVMEK